MSFAISALNFSNAKNVLHEGLSALSAGQSEFDLAQLSSVDSSTVAVLLAWQRAAQAKSVNLALVNAPNDLLNLALLYGVTDLLTLKARATP